MSEGETAGTQLTDKLRVVAVDGTDYASIGGTDHGTSVSVSNLRTALDLIETLGWDAVDIGTFDPEHNDDGNPLLVIEPPHDGVFASGDQAAIAVAPVTDKMRRKVAEEAIADE